MEFVTIIIQQLIIFTIFSAIGVLAIKKRILDENGLVYLSNIIIKITLPVMLFYNTVVGVTKKELISSSDMIPLK